MRGIVHHLQLDEWVDPEVTFRELYSSSRFAFWLDEGDAASTTRTYIGAASLRGVSVVRTNVFSGTLTECDGHGNLLSTRELGVLDFLRESVSGVRPILEARTGLGWVGWLGYELGACELKAKYAPSGNPDAALIYADRSIVFDRELGNVTLNALGGSDGDEWIQKTASRLKALVGHHPPAPSAPAETHVEARWRHDDVTYLRLIDACQELISAGEAYQLCLTNELRLDVHLDPLETFIALRSGSPSAHRGLIVCGNVALVSASPERFLTITPGGEMTTSPIKGTRPRGKTKEEDSSLKAELLASEKEQAENLMIVDLMRNDLARVAESGSVVVDGLFDVETYAHVHQLVSTVRGRRAASASAIDVVGACFPAGSMTGTPKLRAMDHLHELERGPRGLYAGCFGSFGIDGSVALSMTIRSIVIDPDGTSIGSGGGITALSVSQHELEEVKLKARALAHVVGVRGNL